MKKDKGKPPEASDLRGRAQARLAQGDAQGPPPSGEEDSQRLIQELKIHKIELELQNEELRQARQELESSLERYTDLYDFAPVGYFTLDGQGLIQEVNLAGAALLGMTRSRVLGQSLLGFLAQDSMVAFKDFLAQVGGGQAKHSCQVTMGRNGQEPRHLHMEGAPAALPEEGAGKAEEGHVRLAMLDITERRQAEEELKAKTAILEAVFESAPYVMLLVNQEGRVQDINRAGTDFAQRGKQALLGLLGGEVVGCLNSFDGLGCGRNPVCADCPVRTRMERTFARGEAIFNEEGSLSIVRDGQTMRLDLLISASPLKTSAKDLVLVSLMDITHRKQAEEELRRSHAFSNSIIESSHDCIKVLDLQGRLRFMSSGGMRLFGLSDIEPYLGKPYQSFWSGSDLPAVRTALAKAKTGEKGEFQGFCPTASGEPKWWEVTVTPILDARGAVEKLLVVSRDITQRRQAEEEKASLENQLRQAQKMEAIGTLAGGIAHDFNNILGAILGYAEIAKDDARDGKVDPGDLQQIITSVGRAKTLIRQILAFSRKSDSSLSPLDLNLKVEEMVSMSQRVLPKEIAIETGLQADLPRVNCDAGQIDQVLMNLVTNARDAMPEGGRLTIETRGVVLGEEFCRRFIEVKPGDYALLTVTDTGSGMDQPTLERMYDPFFTTKEVGKGTGLGLSTVLGIVKNHGGHIFCDSAPGRGTTFNIYLPIPAQDISRSTPGGESTRAEPHGGGRRILLVDDEQSLRALGSRALTGAGYDVLTASSGEEALNVLGQGSQPPTLVVLDLGMPGMGGLKCLRSMLELSPGLKVLIATGYAAEAQVKEALAAGAAGYVAKPFKRAELLAKIRSVFDSQ